MSHSLTPWSRTRSACSTAELFAATSTGEVNAVPSPAVAPPPGNPRFPLFDSLRAIAVLAVLVFHVTSITNLNADGFVGDVFGVLGDVGLTLFFVISGFLLYRPFVAARARDAPMPSVGRYARRRLLRIVPAYWLALTLLSLYPGISGVFSPDWWRYYLLLTLYSHRTLVNGIPVAWTLCVEVSFYVVLPLWARMARGWRPASGNRAWLASELSSLGCLALFGIVIQVLSSRHLVSGTIADSLLGECVWFALGMALAVLSVADARGELSQRLTMIIAKRPGLCWIAAGTCLLGLAALLRPGSVLNILLQIETKQPYGRTLGAIALTSAMMVLLVSPAVFGADAGGAPRRFLRIRPVAWLGLISYGVYLWHLPIALWLASSNSSQFSAAGLGLLGAIHALQTPSLLLLTLVVSVGAAATSYYVVELPFLRLKERRVR